MRISTRLQGFRELDRKLASLAKAVDQPTREEALGAGGDVIADRAKELVHVRSGELRDAIETKVEGQGQNTTAVVGPKQGGGYPDGWYGHLEEFGTNDTRPHPFMRPAYDEKVGEAKRAVGTKLRDRIRDA